MKKITPFTAVPYRGQSRDDLVVTVNTWFSEVSGFVAEANALIEDINTAAEASVFSAPDWVAQPYRAHETVIYTDHNVYISTEAVLATDIPSVSEKWKLLNAESSTDTYSSITSATDVSLTVEHSTVAVNTTNDYLFVKLPDATLMDTTKTFTLFNSGTKSFGVEDFNNGFIAGLKSGQSCELYLADNGTSSGVWLTKNTSKTQESLLLYTQRVAYVANSVSASGVSCVFLTDSTFIVAYYSSSAVRFKIGTIAQNGSIIYGAEGALASSNSYNTSIRIERLTDSTAVLFASYNDSIKMVHLTNNSGSITQGSVTTVSTDTYKAFTVIDATRVILTYSSSNYPSAVIYSLSGTSYVIGTPLVGTTLIDPSGFSPIGISPVYSGYLYFTYGSSNPIYGAKIGTINFSGSTISSISVTNSSPAYGGKACGGIIFQNGLQAMIKYTVYQLEDAGSTASSGGLTVRQSQYAGEGENSVILNGIKGMPASDSPYSPIYKSLNTNSTLFYASKGTDSGNYGWIYLATFYNGSLTVNDVLDFKLNGYFHQYSQFDLSPNKKRMLICTTNSSSYPIAKIVEVNQ